MAAEDSARALFCEYERTQEIPTLRQAVALYHRVLLAAPRQAPERAGCVGDLAVALFRLYQRIPDVTLLQEAAQAAREAVVLTRDDGGPDYVNRLNNLSLVLVDLSKQTKDPMLLPEAVLAARNALAAMSADHPDRIDELIHLGRTLHLSYEWIGKLPEGREAVQAFRDALDGLRPGDPRHTMCLTELSIALRLIYQRAGGPSTLYEAVELARRAVATAGPDDPNLAAHEMGLCNALRLLAERGAEPGALGEALAIARRLVGYLAGDVNHAVVLNVLALTLRQAYERNGELAVLREAVQIGRDAVAATPSPYLHLPTYKMNLAGTQRMLASETGDLALAREAVVLSRDAVPGFAPDDPERATSVAILSNALVTVDALSDEREAKVEAVRAAEEAVEATPYEHADYVPRLTTLISALLTLYRHTRVRALLDRAVRAARNAVASTPSDHPDRATYQTNLSVVLEAAAEAGAAESDLAEAVRFARDAVASTPPDQPQRAAHLSNLGSALALLGEQTGDAAAIRECVGAYTAVVRMTIVPVADRIRAAGRAARLALRADHRRQAMALVETAAELLPQLTVRDVDRASRERRLRIAFDLAAMSAAVAISIGKPDRAVELLEQTRGLVLASTLETRSDITQLRAHSPDLAASFDDLRRAVNVLDHESVAPAPSLPVAELGARSQELAHRRARLNQEWDHLLARIRQRRGMEAFLRPQPIDELRKQATAGPLVYVTVHEQRGHALIIHDDPAHPVHALELPADATASAVREQASKLDVARRIAVDPEQPTQQRHDAQQDILDVLGWIWDTITEPVLDHLGLTTAASADEVWPRIWWCPVGLVSFLPLHAAGRHADTAKDDTVMDRAVSSYTPTIRALAYARSRRSAPSSTLVVAVPDAPDCPPLNAALREALVVSERVRSATVLPPAGGTADHDSVIEALQRHSIAHLACHSLASWADPASSRLILHDHLVKPLTLHSITRLDLEQAQLAYLSACSTTDNHPLQSDESTHLAAAFQLAGYRNVIATIWPITDSTAVRIAGDVYSNLTLNGANAPDPDMAAQALHQAARKQRNRTPTLPTRWAAYIHYGI